MGFEMVELRLELPADNGEKLESQSVPGKPPEPVNPVFFLRSCNSSAFWPYSLLQVRNDFPQRNTERPRNPIQGDKRGGIDAKLNGSQARATHVTAL